jgi:CSLREA domain-containing protein/uncharacterized repeat protein (TIGR02543 family)
MGADAAAGRPNSALEVKPKMVRRSALGILKGVHWTAGLRKVLIGRLGRSLRPSGPAGRALGWLLALTLAFGGLTGVVGPATPAQAATVTFTVNTTADTVDTNPGDGTCADASGNCSLRAAIMEVNALMRRARGQFVIQIPAGTFQLIIPRDPSVESEYVGGAPDDVDSMGDLDILPANQSSVTIKGAGMDQTIISAQGLNTRVLQIRFPRDITDAELGGTVEIQDLTVTAGVTEGNGGGISAAGSLRLTLTLTRVALRGNQAAKGGGGLWANTYITVVQDSEFTDNVARGGGGGMAGFTAPQGGVTVKNSLFARNKVFSRCTGNVWGDPPTCSGWPVIGGGALQLQVSGGSAWVGNVTVADNLAPFGGGLFFSADSSFRVENVTVYGNRATLEAYEDPGNFQGNDPSFMFRGGGIFVQGPGSVAIAGSIIYGNVVGQGGLGPNCYGGTSGGYNILGSDCTGSLFSRATTDQMVDPQLGSLADNGGPTRTMLPQTGSPAIDAIPGGQGPCSGSTLRDQRGVARPQGNNCDIGAVEVEVAAPGAPQNVQARAGIGRVSLSWNRVPEAYAYWVYRGSSAGVSKTSYDQRYQVFKDPTSPNESFMVSGLQNNTTYYFVVTAVNRLGESAESSVVSATPVPGYTLSVTVPGSPPGGRVTSNDGRINCGSGGTACSATYEPDPPATVTLTAVPDPGYVFVGWSGSCSGTSPSVTLTMDANKSCTAQFSNQVTLTVQKQGAGSGTVTSNPPGIDCGQDCSEVYQVGTQVTLTANPAQGSVFAGWSGDCSGTNPTTTVTMDGNKRCTARFETAVTLTVQISGGGTGTVSSNPAGIACPPTCTAQFMSGSTVSLAATAGQNSFFTGWLGDCSGTSPATSIQLTGNKNCTANFSPAQTLLSEDFSGGIPSTWQVVDGGSGGGNAATWTTTNPGNRSIGAPFSPPFAIVDSDAAGEFADQDEQLITPSLPASCVTQSGRVFLNFANQFRQYEAEKADVDITTDGTNWTNVLRMQGGSDGYPTPNIKSVELTSQVQGAQSFRIRFRYYNANFAWWWAIDNVRVVCVLSGSGAQPPAPPQNVQAVPGDGQVTLSWSPVQGATFYNIYMATQSGVTKANWQSKPGGMKHEGITGTTFTHTGLQNGTTYYFVVTAVNAAGESAESQEVSATPQASGGGTSATVTTPGGQVQVGLQGGTFTQGPTAQNVTPPQGWQVPYGAIAFAAQVPQAGGSVTVTLTFPQPIPQGAQLWKFVNNQWLAVPNAQLSGNTATFQVQDGGPLDADGQANGQVADPVALLVPQPGPGAQRLFLPFISKR